MFVLFYCISKGMKDFMSLDYNNPERYIGSYKACFIGYSNNVELRENAASGGVVTAILINMLQKGIIDGAFVSKQKMINGEVSGVSYIATSESDLLDSRTSIYADFPLPKYFKEMLDFKGKLAVVALPCQLRALNKFIDENPQLKDKIVLKVSLFCGGTPKRSLIKDILKKNKINPLDVKKFYFRKGHWRGQSSVDLNNGEVKSFSYTNNICTYKNLYFGFLDRCFSCSNHFGYDSDISCGDVWLKEMKKHPIKHTGIIAKSDNALKLLEDFKSEGILSLQEIEAKKVLKSQKRALNFKFGTASTRKFWGSLFGIKSTQEVFDHPKFLHKIAAILIVLNIKASRNRIFNKLIFLLPRKVLFLYMGFLRTLLN